MNERLGSEIASLAPLRLDHYIELCLFHSEEGYYQKREVFGPRGDFITAPEISQIFGEMIGAWVASEWIRLGQPSEFALIELGPGRGVLMQDLLRAVSTFPACDAALRLYLFEKSTKLRALQKERIHRDVSFLDDLITLPQLPTIVVSNEFFDALPIRQFRFEDGGWLEAYVSKDLKKIWLAEAFPPLELRSLMNGAHVIEISELAIKLAKGLGDHLEHYGGAALHVDYGEWDGVGDTLQALRDHQPVDPFSNFGKADLTAHVRFRDLAEAARLDCRFMTQGDFLEMMGGAGRLDQLCHLHEERADMLRGGYARLTLDQQMGKIFKAMIWEA